MWPLGSEGLLLRHPHPPGWLGDRAQCQQVLLGEKSMGALCH